MNASSQPAGAGRNHRVSIDDCADPSRAPGRVVSFRARCRLGSRFVAAQPAKELPKAATMATEYLRVLVNTVAIRDEPGSTDRLGDFTKNDAVKLIKPCTSDGVPEWVEVDMVGTLHDQQKPQRKKRRKDDSHRGAFVDLTKTADPLSKDGRQYTRYSRANKH